MNGQEIWNEVRDILRSKLSPSTFENTFDDVTKVGKTEPNGLIYVITPSPFSTRNINTLYYKQIEKIVDSLELEKKVKLKFVCENDIPQDKVPKVNFTETNELNINQNNTFDSFVVGESNRNAFLVASKVAQSPGNFINPLYIFGGVGLGKTHLMQAIGNYISDENLETKVLYIQANDFATDFAKANVAKKFDDFERKYSNIDVLLIDDIQMLKGRDGSQAKFFELFQELSNHNKQIVITSDVNTSQLEGFTDRLKSRFSMGMVVNIDKPDYKQRLSILKKKAVTITNKIVPEDVLSFIAEQFTDNIRELEGALNRVIICSDFGDGEITLEKAKDDLEILIKPKKTANNYDNVLSVIADAYSITMVDILGAKRSSKYILPRHIAMYILKEKYNLTYQTIGHILNGRDHTTIMNGYGKIEEELKINDQLKQSIESIMKKLGNK